jgi:ABC-type sugar transport system substrate-binding protein
MRAAAKDLEIELAVYHADGDLDRMRDQVVTALAMPTKPDYIIFPATERVGPHLLDIAERAGVYALIINAGLSDDQRDITKGPRVRYKRWLGTVTADDLLGGYLLGRSMYRHAQRRQITAPDGRIRLIGMTHSATDERAVDRLAGLRLAEQEYYRGDIAFLGVASGSKARAQQLLQRGYETYPGTTLFWSSDDLMALGMMEALSSRTRRIPGQDAILGGFYWSPWAVQAVIDGEISFLMGGHFMTGGAALIMLYDHANGVDFKPVGAEQRFGFGLLHGGNVKQVAPILARRNWSWIDFKSFSRALNPKRTGYRFSASEPPRVCRRLISVSYAAMSDISRAA